MKSRLQSLLSRFKGTQGRRSNPSRPTDVSAHLEALEDRALLSAITARLTIFANGEQVSIPSGIGVEGTNRLSQIRTDDADGNITIEPIDTEDQEDQTLGDFFDLWRTNAGDPGNNPDAVFNGEQLLDNTTDFDNDVRVFVNGQVNTEFDSYVIQDLDEIVIAFGSNPLVSINTNLGPIVIELFEPETPGTVENFLNYVNDGDYINSFIHRSDPDFVIQGGGFTTPTTAFTDDSQFNAVPTDPAIQNEPGISNLRGTIAMAKLGGDPNSATSQWFVNLSDSNTFLDSSNGGFTVFGQVLDLQTVDEIEALDVNNDSNPPFGELPLTDDDELVVVSSVEGLGTITGVRFEDVDADGIFGTGDVPIAGLTVYVDANLNGVLDADELTATTDALGQYRFDLAAGQHTVRADSSTIGGFSNPTDGSFTVDVEIGRTVAGQNFGEVRIAAPTGLSLLAGSDTGTSDSDRITNLNNSDGNSTMQFEVTGVTDGATVELLIGSISLGTAPASGDSVIVTTNGTQALTDGSFSITARQTVDSETSNDSVALLVTVDSQEPAEFPSSLPTTTPVDQQFAFDVAHPEEGTGRYSVVNAPAGLTIDETSGALSWTPNASQTGPQLFDLQFEDQAGNIRTSNVVLTVLTDVPARPDSFNVNAGTTFSIDAGNGVLANDGPSNNGALAATIVTQPTNGTVTLNADGSFDYTPNAGFTGTDQFRYSAGNSVDSTNEAIVTLTVAEINTAPIGNDDSFTVAEDSTLNASTGVLENDTDPENDILTAQLLTNAENGLVSQFGPDGTFTYTPNANFVGTDTFTYEVTDGQFATGPVTVTITVENVNDGPDATADDYDVDEDSVLTVDAANGVLSNDSDPEGSDITANLVLSPSNGTLNFSNDGSFTYTPNPDFFGPDQFTYFATDGTNDSVTAIVSLTVNPEPDPPTANDIVLTANANQTNQILDVLSNDSSDPDDTEVLVVSLVSAGSEGGTTSISADGLQVLYTPATDFLGDETFTYTIEDSDGLTATATATVTVSAVNAQDGVIGGVVFVDLDGDGIRDADEGGIPGVELTLGGASTDTFITDDEGEWEFTGLDAGTYSVTQTQPTAYLDGAVQVGSSGTAGDNTVTGIVLTGLNSVTNTNFGEASISSEFASIRWRLASNYRDGANAFRGLAADIEAAAGNDTLANAIRDATTDANQNEVPRTVNEAYETSAGESISISATEGVLANDRDADGQTLTATLTAQSANGTVTLNSDGSFDYTPDNGFSGIDSFEYSVTDGIDTSVASASILVAEIGPTFSVSDSAIRGTSVGSVSSALAAPIFEIQDVTQPEELNLLTDDHISGDPAASVVLIEYLDYQCPACAALHPIVVQMEQDFDGDLLVVRRHLPLTAINANALSAAQAAEAAAAQGAFEEMSDLLFENQADWSLEDDPQPFFEDYATELNLDLDQFRADMNDPATADRIDRDRGTADDLNATSTPTVFLNGELITNPSTDDEFSDVIQSEIDSLDNAFALNRSTGEITVRDSSLLDEATESLTVRATDANGDVEIIGVSIDVNGSTAAGPVIDSVFNQPNDLLDSV